MTATFATTRQDAPTTRPAWHRVALGGVAGWLAGTAAVEAYAALGRAAGLPMLAGAPGASAAQPVAPMDFAFGVFICTFWGTVLAYVIGRFASRPARTFALTTMLLTALSLASPLAAAHTADATKLFLTSGHLLVAAIVIPTLASRLPRQRR